MWATFRLVGPSKSSAHQNNAPEQRTRTTHQSSAPEQRTRTAHQNSAPEQRARAAHQNSAPEQRARAAHQNSAPEQRTRAARQSSAPEQRTRAARQNSAPEKRTRTTHQNNPTHQHHSDCEWRDARCPARVVKFAAQRFDELASGQDYCLSHVACSNRFRHHGLALLSQIRLSAYSSDDREVRQVDRWGAGSGLAARWKSATPGLSG